MAANNIKGITIEINGDTKPLTTALKSVDGQLKDTQAALKDVNKLLKVDPHNTELLTQKQKLLNEAIDETNTRLQMLKDAQSQVGEGTREWDGLQREIIATEQSLEGLEETQKETGNAAQQTLRAVGDKLKEVGGKITEVGQKLMPVSAAAAALGGAAVAAFNEVDAGADTIIKKTGASGEALDDMTKRMENLARTIPTDFETAGTAIGEVNTRFGLTGDALEDLSGRFIRFAELNGTDVNNSIDTVQAAMAAFSVDASHAGDVLDILNKAGQDTGISMDKLAQDLTSNGPVLQEMGFDLDSAAGFLANLNKNGLDASTVMGGLKKALQNATKDGKSMEQALQELQTAMQGAESDTEAAQLAMDLFGNKAGPALASAIREGKISLDEAANSIQDWSDSVNTTFDATLDPIDQVTLMFNDLKAVGAELGATLMEVLLPVFETLRDVINRIVEAYRNLTPEQQELIAKIILVVAAIGPLLIIIGQVVSGIGSVVGALSMLASPVGIAVAAIAGLIAIFATLYATNEDFRNKVNEVWDAIKEKISGVIEIVKQIIQTFVEIVKAIWERWGDDIKLVVSTVFDTIDTTVRTTLEAVQTFLAVILDLINGDWEGAWNKIKDFAINTFGKLYDGVKEKVTMVKDIIMEKIGEAVDWIKGLPEQALQWGRDLLDNFIGGIKEKAGALKDAVSGAANGIASFLGFSEPDEGPLSNFHTFAPDMMELFASGIRDNLHLITDELQAVTSTIAGSFAAAGPAPSTINVTSNTYLDGELISSRVDTLLGEAL